MQRKNKQWFTLVELIIVITILAILATIAFVSFQGYSSEARDSGKMSEISEIVKAIAVKEARDTSFTLSGIVTWGTASGTLNLGYLGLNSKNDYAVAINSNSGTYLIAAKMEKYDPSTSGVYNLSGSLNYFVWGNQFISGTWTTAKVWSGWVLVKDFFGTLPTK